MKKTGSILITTVYHIKPTLDKKFIKIWNEKIAPLSYHFGSDRAGLYHNENTDEFFSISHWDNYENATLFLNSEEFKKFIDEVNECCLIPLSQHTHEIAHEKTP